MSKIKLINALRKAAEKILQPNSDYDWLSCSQCNCGMVVRELIPVPDEKIKGDLYLYDIGLHACWGNSAIDGYCQTTGLPIALIFKILSEFGFEAKDYGELEICGNREVLARMNVAKRIRDYARPEFVSRYMLAWADILAEQEAEAFETRALIPVSKPAEPQPHQTPGI